MLFVGLTGGIGSGKSTVAGMLAARGAVVLDADAIARDVVAVGTPGFDRVVELFGPSVVGPDGDLDRARIGSVVFDDERRRRALEAIVHPEVRRRIAAEMAAYVGTSAIVVVDSPLLIETGAYRDSQVVVVVSAAPATQLARLTARGVAEAHARARMAAQMPLEDKAAVADVLLDNEGTLEELRAQVDRLWTDLRDQAEQDA
jgi:dephospho-CoA kinase